MGKASIDPITMLAVVRAQADIKTTEGDLVDPIIQFSTKKKKTKKKSKSGSKEASQGNAALNTGEVHAEKGVYYNHQVKSGALYCIDKKGDKENRIFKQIYNGELPVYKALYKRTISSRWIPKKKIKKGNIFKNILVVN